MSRIPQPSSRSPLKSPSKPTNVAPTNVAQRQKTLSTPSKPAPALRAQRSLASLKTTRSPSRKPSPEPPVPKSPSPLSIKEQIALRRAELKKASVKPATPVSDFEGLEEADPIAINKNAEEDPVDLGRWSIREAIERARSTGAINLASRALPCIPTALFDIHLGVKPEPLQSVTQEPPIGSSSEQTAFARRKLQKEPSWYEAQDLEILKAWSNEIVEIQPELSMFGSLKIIDLHNNKIVSLPDSFADLTALTNLDLSHNALTTLPVNLFALPNITVLNVSHNQLSALPFNAPFSSANANPLARTKDSRGDWFSQPITRATAPLPRLSILDASYNRITTAMIDPELPAMLSKIDLSSNPLDRIESLLLSLARLDRLCEARFEHTNVADDSFPVTLFNTFKTACFPQLKVLDLGETHVTRAAIEAAVVPSVIKQQLDFDLTTEDPRTGTLRVIIGKKIIKEAWEVEAERRAYAKKHAAANAEEGLQIGGGRVVVGGGRGRAVPAGEPAKEAWELEAEQGLLTEGARRRARAAAQVQGAGPSPTTSTAAGSDKTNKAERPKVTEKEAWEIEAEQGLLTEGAKRRARAAAMAKLTEGKPTSESQSSAAPVAASPAAVASALSSPQFYSAASQTLTLPPSAPPRKAAAHMRSFSLAAPSAAVSRSESTELALGVPTPTLPLDIIVAQPYAQTLKVLILTNRRSDPLFSLPDLPDGVSLPSLEELSLEGCNLSDTVSTSRGGERACEPLLLLLARLFPSLRTLDLSYNALTSAALTKDALAGLILATTADDGQTLRAGLRQLRLRGNRLAELDGFQALAESFKGNRDVPGWKVEELDLRDNEINKLPPELGLLPMEVFLVDGNTFRVPARRVWEREGTKGLLSWLRGRIEYS